MTQFNTIYFEDS